MSKALRNSTVKKLALILFNSHLFDQLNCRTGKHSPESLSSALSPTLDSSHDQMGCRGVPNHQAPSARNMVGARTRLLFPERAQVVRT